MLEPKIGEIFSLHGIKVKTCPMRDDEHCDDCAFAYLECSDIDCYSISREDLTQVIFKEVEQIKIKPMEVKIQIPDNCELIKDGDTYIVKEKKQGQSRSWEEFCERYPIKNGEAYISPDSVVLTFKGETFRNAELDKCVCTSKEEAEAFCALMQLRQLRKAWVGDWKPDTHYSFSIIVYHIGQHKIIVEIGNWLFNYPLTFPTPEMAKDFLNCFKDLCETAKILL